jgi:uncharacterized membrane protein
MSGRTEARDVVRRDVLRFTGSMTGRSLAGIAGGVLLAIAMLALDRVLGWRAPIPTDNARSVASALLGGVLTIAVFTLWMRTVVVGLASGQVSPRVVSSYLDDSFQRAVTGWMVGALTYLASIALLLPTGLQDAENTPEGGVPMLSGALALLVGVAALVAVLAAMRHAVASLSPPHLIRQLTDRANERVASPRLPHDPLPEVMPDPLELQHVRSNSLGWVRSVDYPTIAERLPASSTALLPLAIGDFVAPGETLLLCDPGVEQTDLDAIQGAISIDRTRDTAADLAFAIQQLVDVVQHALGPASNDTSTAYEALVHLRAVLHGVIRRGDATGCFDGGDDRRVVCTAGWDPVDHLDDALERLRNAAAQDAVATRSLANTLTLLVHTAEEVGDTRSRDLLTAEQDRLRDLAEHLRTNPGG